MSLENGARRGPHGGTAIAAIAGADRRRPAPVGEVRSRVAEPVDAALAALLRRARTGDSAALGALYDRYAGLVYRYLYRRTGDAVLSEDLTQGVFLRVVEAIADDASWQSSFSGWLFRIAHNAMADHYRTRARRPVAELDVALPAARDEQPDAQAYRLMAHATVRRALRKIQPRQAEILVLRFAEGWTHAEVAVHLGSTPGAVKVAQHRALAALRTVLEDEHYEEDGR